MANGTVCGILANDFKTVEVISTTTPPAATVTVWNGSGWSNGVPTELLDAVVAGDYTFGASFSVDNLTLNNGIVFSPVNDIDVKGTVTNNGASVAGIGAIVFSGTSAQTLAGGTFNNIKVNNNSGLTLTAATGITGTLTMQNGPLTTNNNLTLVSNSASQCACLDTVTYNGAISGNITVERQTADGMGRYFYHGTPVKNQTLSDWQNDVSMSQTYTYDPTTAVNDGWTAAIAGTSLIPGKGLIYFGNAGKLTTTGEVIIGDGTGNASGNFDFGLTYDESGYRSSGLTGWNLLANPYPCTINWEQMTKANMELVYWLWDGTGYQFYKQGGTKGGSNSGADVNGQIASGQGFFIRAASTSASLTTQETDKSSSATASVLSTTMANRLGMTVHKMNGNGLSTQSDRSYIGLAATATVNYDLYTDLVKFNNPDLNLSSYVQLGNYLSINMLPLHTQSVKLAVTGTAGNYSLNFDGLGSFAAGSQFFLQDKYLNNITDLTTQPNYSFSITANNATQGNDRFEIVMVPMAITGLTSNSTANAAGSISIYPNPAKGWFEIAGSTTGSLYELVSVTGQVAKAGQIQSNNQRVETAGVSSGVYLLQIRTATDIVTKKLVIE